jgi:dGTPase
MPRTREELEQIERQILAPYAQLSSETRGRKHVEPPPEWRTQYQRDRDRIIHSRAFRRLEYKTQVFLNGTGDHLRTRLTHTMEVAGISRNIARALKLNEDLTESIALAHDLGHSPFGHKGEAVINQLMKLHGGFEHNRHSLRLVEELEQKYPSFPGLNLSWEVREGLVKHYTAFDHPGRREGFEAKQSSLEAQVANLADEIAYYSHDLDDGLDSGLLCESELVQHVRLWAVVARSVKQQYGRLPDECRRYFTIRTIIDLQVKDVVQTSVALIEKPECGRPMRCGFVFAPWCSTAVSAARSTWNCVASSTRISITIRWSTNRIFAPSRSCGIFLDIISSIPRNSVTRPAAASSNRGCIAPCAITWRA